MTKRPPVPVRGGESARGSDSPPHTATGGHLTELAIELGARKEEEVADAVNDILGGRGGRTAAFKEHGDSVEGEIVRYDQFQRRDIKTKEPLSWPDGNPKMNIVITVQTVIIEDDDDDGMRNIYINVPSQPLAALRQALMKARAKGIAEGGYLTATFVSTDKPSGPGMSGQKQFAFEYEAPQQVNRLPADGDVPYCGFHHTDLMQSPRTGQWGHVVDGAACLGKPADDDDSIPF